MKKAMALGAAVTAGVLTLSGCAKEVDGTEASEKASSPSSSASVWEAPEGYGSQDKASPTPHGRHAGDVKITGHRYAREFQFSTEKSLLYTYKITNSGQKAATYMVDIEAYDKDGDFLGRSPLIVERLGPGKTASKEQSFGTGGLTNGDEEDVRTMQVGRVSYCDGGEDPTGDCALNGL